MAAAQVARDDLFHHFDRAPGDLDDARVGVGPAFRVLLHVAGIPVMLQEFVDHRAEELGRHELGGGIDRIEYACDLMFDAAIDEYACDDGRSGKVGKLELRVLEIRDGQVESAAPGPPYSFGTVQHERPAASALRHTSRGTWPGIFPGAVVRLDSGLHKAPARVAKIRMFGREKRVWYHWRPLAIVGLNITRGTRATRSIRTSG